MGSEVDTSRVKLKQCIADARASLDAADLLLEEENPAYPGIRWMRKGGRFAGPNEPFAWYWARKRDSDEVKEETAELVRCITQSYEGNIIVGPYNYSLSPDGRILRRVRV